MKTIIKSTVAVLALALLSTSVFAADKTKTDLPATNTKDVVLFTSPSQNDVELGVIIHKATPSRSSVTIYDKAGVQVYKDVMSKSADVVLKGYQLGALEEGDYIIKVTTNNEDVKRAIHVYKDEKDQKNFFFMM
jgi:hypothetical protein